MDEAAILFGVLLALLALFGLPIWALVRTFRIKELETRLAGVEAALLRVTRELEQRPPAPVETAAPPAPPSEPAAVKERPVAVPLDASAPPPPPPEFVPPPGPPQPEGPRWEEIIGERWLGWVGISTLLFGAAFFLKYAFDNQWIGELGRVLIGVFVALGFLWFGGRKRKDGWTMFGQIFTAGGVILLYLSIYASYGFYSLMPAGAAFAFMALVVALAHLLAVFYPAPAIAVMGQIGGILTPVLLSTGSDRYGVLFSYLALLAGGALLVAVWRQWRWIAVISFGLTHLMYWAWWADNYHPEKAWAAVAFQTALFVLFLAGDLLPTFRGQKLTPWNWVLLFLNPFFYFGALYVILDDEAPFWAGPAAMLLAAVYAFLARTSLSRKDEEGRLPWALVAVALLFVTLAIPIQLEAEWITLAWGIQGAVLAWMASRMPEPGWRFGSGLALGLALFHQLVFDWAWGYRGVFTPVFNADFLGALGVAACLLAATWFLRDRDRHFALATAFSAILLTWLAGSLEIIHHYDRLAREIPYEAYDARRSIEWTGGMALSVLWAVYATALVAGGMRFSKPLLRWTGLALFGLTVLKAFFVDIPALEGFYRVIALITVGVLLLAVGWGYQRMSRRNLEAVQS